MLRSVFGLTMVLAITAQAGTSNRHKTKSRPRAAKSILGTEAQQNQLVKKLVEAVKAAELKEHAPIIEEKEAPVQEVAPVVEVAPVPVQEVVPTPPAVVIPPRFVAMPPPEVTRFAQRSGKPSPAAWIFGSAALVAGGAGALTTYWGRKDNDALAACAPWCPTSAVNHVRAMYITSDISFGIGAASLIASVWFFARSPVAVTLQPSPTGTSAVVMGRF